MEAFIFLLFCKVRLIADVRIVFFKEGRLVIPALYLHMDLQSSFLCHFREQAAIVAAANPTFEKEHITGLLIRNTIGSDKTVCPELWAVLKATGDTEITLDSCIKAARLILEAGGK